MLFERKVLEWTYVDCELPVDYKKKIQKNSNSKIRNLSHLHTRTSRTRFRRHARDSNFKIQSAIIHSTRNLKSKYDEIVNLAISPDDLKIMNRDSSIFTYVSHDDVLEKKQGIRMCEWVCWRDKRPGTCDARYLLVTLVKHDFYPRCGAPFFYYFSRSFYEKTIKVIKNLSF